MLPPPDAAPRLPAREGVVGSARPEAAAGRRRALPARVTALADLAGDFAFFHHWALYALGGLAVDVATDACRRAGIPAAEWPAEVPLGVPILAAPEPLLPASLGAVARPHWPVVRDALRAASAVDRRRRRYWRAAAQPWRMVDPLGDPSAPPRPVDVWFFAPDGTDGHFDFAPAGGPEAAARGYPLRIRRNPPGGEVLALGRMLLDDDHRFLRAAEPKEHPADVLDRVRSLRLPT